MVVTNTTNRVSNTSSIDQVNLFLDKDVVLGRIAKASLSHEPKNPDLVRKYSTISQLIIRYYHENTAHSGREMAINEIRHVGNWIIIFNSAVKSLIAQCIICKHLRGNICHQKMSDLPRMAGMPRDFPRSHHSYTVILIMFGTILTQEGCKEMKRYGCLLTCLSSRTIYIAFKNSLCSNAFIQALQRFVSRRGNVCFSHQNWKEHKFCWSQWRTKQDIFQDESKEN